MNLRSSGILFSVLPLLLTLLLAIPETLVQLDARQAVAQAGHADSLSELARNVEESALDVGSVARTLIPADRYSRERYSRAVTRLRLQVAELNAGVRSQTGRSEARNVDRDVEAYLHSVAEAIASSERKAPHAAVGTLGRGIFADRLRRSTITFDDRAHNNELGALAAIDRLWKSSLTLLVLAVIGMTFFTLLLLYYSGEAVDGILELLRKAERYRRGVPLGKSSPRSDEIGDLDRGIHEFAIELQQREHLLKRYRLLAEVTQDIILFIDRVTLTITDANAAAIRAYGYPELIGKPNAVLHAADDPIDDQTMALSDRPEGLSYEGLHQRADGTVFPVEVHARTAEVDGRLTIIKTIRDISERRHAAEQVALALDQAVEASRLKSEFVATMSHEIRTPMQGVIGMSELLLKTQLLPTQRDYAATVQESAQALLAIIDDILDFSKLEAQKLELETVTFDPAQLVSSATNLVRVTAEGKGLSLRSKASPHVPPAVRGDPTRVRQVLINLIGNAVKFTPSGEVTVSTSLERDDGSTVVLLFKVSDTGIGVTPEARTHLFEAFVQGDGSTTRRFGGTGLGLSICRRLVELMGGSIWLGEHEGPGSTFCFTARFERTSEILPIAAAATGALHLRVLVLDDDEAARRSFEGMLSSWGLTYASCEDVVSARSCLRKAASEGKAFDVVVIDFVLPRSDGLAFAAEIGERPEYGSPARILMTAFDALGRKAAGLAAGCCAYLVKPVDPSELYNALAAVERKKPGSITRSDGEPKRVRILMAEDSALIRRVARFQLEELECPVDIVENGQQAVDAIATGNYELVLMDMRMPDMDGLAATRAIRETERVTGNHIVVIALTANVLEADREACIEAGMDDFLAKPLKLDALRAALERWLPEFV